MYRQQQDVLACRTREQTHPQDGPLLQIERAIGVLGQARLELIVAPGCRVGLSKMDFAVLVDLLNRAAGCEEERGPERRMAIDQGLKRAAQGCDIQIGAYARRESDVVNRAFRRKLVKEPYPLLIIGKRK